MNTGAYAVTLLKWLLGWINRQLSDEHADRAQLVDQLVYRLSVVTSLLEAEVTKQDKACGSDGAGNTQVTFHGSATGEGAQVFQVGGHVYGKGGDTR